MIFSTGLWRTIPIIKRTPFAVDSYKVLKYAEERSIEGHITSFAVTDLYFYSEELRT